MPSIEQARAWYAQADPVHVPQEAVVITAAVPQAPAVAIIGQPRNQRQFDLLSRNYRQVWGGLIHAKWMALQALRIVRVKEHGVIFLRQYARQEPILFRAAFQQRAQIHLGLDRHISQDDLGAVEDRPGFNQGANIQAGLMPVSIPERLAYQAAVHQCVRVELEDTPPFSNVYVQRSAQRNMDFGNVASAWRRPVTVNTRGWGAPAYGAAAHKLIIEGVQPPPGRIYDATETPNGELGFYIISDGSGHPYRIKCRPPCFYTMNGLKFLIEGGMVADIVAILGGLNVIAGELDR